MFWNKKCSTENPNPIIVYFKKLWNEVADSYKCINDAMQTVIAREKIVNYYPESTNKETAIKRLEEARNRFSSIVTMYDKKREKLFQYYITNKREIDSKLSWSPYQWKEGVDVVEDWYKREQMTFIKRG